MPITPTSTLSKNYQALGIDEIANDIETAFTRINSIEANGLPVVADNVTITGTGTALDPLVSVAPTAAYKVYTALLTQTGTNAPVATVLENTLGGTVVWTRTGIGQYKGTLVGAFPIAKYVQPPQASLGTDFYVNDGGNTSLPAGTNVSAMFYWRGNSNEILLFTINTGAYIDGELSNTAIDIKVYN